MMIKDGLQRESNKMEIRSKTELQKTLDPTENQYKKTITPEDAARAQMIITTHDGIWYDQLCVHQRIYKMGGNFRNLEIIRWTPEASPIIEPYKPRIERIEEYVSASNKRAAGNESRQYLEWLLKEVCEKTLTAPSHYKRSGLYTVREFLDPAKKRIEGLIRDETFNRETLDKFQELEKTVIIGNLLSHDNILIERISITEVEEFFNAVRNIHDAFSCPECGRFVQYYRELRVLRCAGRCDDPMEIECR